MKSPPRGKDDINSYLQANSTISLPYLQLLVRSNKLVSAVFSNICFETKLPTLRKLAPLIFKIDGLNLHQIEPPDPSVVSIGIGRPSMPPDAALFQIRQRTRTSIYGVFLSLPKICLCSARFTEERWLIQNSKQITHHGFIPWPHRSTSWQLPLDYVLGETLS